MLLDGILGSEAIDSSGECLCVSGADISDWEAGTLLCNWEHEPGEKGASTIVGKVVYAKKIFSKDDCDNDRQLEYWNKIKLPLIYGVIRLFDGAGHAEAQRIAAIIRDCAANNEMLACRYSVEGKRLDADKTSPYLKHSIIRRIAITVQPCNRSANSGLLLDPKAPEGFKKQYVKNPDDFITNDTHKFEDPEFTRLGGSVEVECNPLIAKALSAGSMNGSPGSLVQGAALQKEDLGKKVVELIRKYAAGDFKKDEFRAYIKHELPGVSDEYIDHFVNAAENFHADKKVLKAESPVMGLLHDMQDQISVNRLQALSVEVNHALAQLKGAQHNPRPRDYLPEIHTVDMRNGDDLHPVGRILVHDGRIRHLEDYHGLLAALLPEGRMDEHAAARMYALSTSPHLSVTRDLPEPEPEQPLAVPVPEAPAAPPMPEIIERPPSVFQYKRAGMERPHTLEVQGDTYLLDGNLLSPEEVQIILSNVSQRAAEIRYMRGGTAANKVQKMESSIRDLVKSLEDTADDERAQLHDLLMESRRLVEAGQMAPKHERALTRFLYGDRMTPGLGNKAAAEEFVSKKKPGVYIQMDGNGFKSINDNHGHAAGDKAIKAFGQYAREAMDEAVGRGPGGGKLFRTPDDQDIFRNGGDEFMAHVPSHEHAAKFARLLAQKLDAHPPINGHHKLSMSFGFGLDPGTADSALYHAKAQKYHPGTTQSKHPVGMIPNMAHSLVPGHEGAIPMHEPEAAAIHHSVAPAPTPTEPPKTPTATVPEAPKAEKPKAA